MRVVSYSILFRQFPLDQLDALVPVVRQVYGINDFDARMKVRRGWGFLERNVTEEEAQRIVAAMGDCAGGVIAIDNAQLRAPTEPKVMTALEIAPNGFTPQWQSPQEPTRLIAWSEVGIVAAGGFSVETLRHESGGDEKKIGKMLMGLGVFAVTGVPIGIFGGRKKKKETKPVQSSHLITFGRIVTIAGEQFVFNLDHFDFSGLGAKRQLNTAANFRVLLGELARLTTARLNRGARLLLQNQSISFANYSNLHDFETELLWMVNVAVTAS